MKVGTKSLLFGVHQFLWHPLTVALAWRKYHGRWPRGKAEWVAILVHDWGYWGCADMDGEQGKDHPLWGAHIAWRILAHDEPARLKAINLILGHSKSFSAGRGKFLSDLYAPDKLSVLFEPKWFYLFRGLATGEIREYIEQAAHSAIVYPHRYMTPRKWLDWYCAKTRSKFYDGTGKLRVLRVRDGDARPGVDLSGMQANRGEGS